MLWSRARIRARPALGDNGRCTAIWSRSKSALNAAKREGGSGWLASISWGSKPGCRGDVERGRTVEQHRVLG